MAEPILLAATLLMCVVLTFILVSRLRKSGWSLRNSAAIDIGAEGTLVSVGSRVEGFAQKVICAAGYDTVENVLKRMQKRRATTQMYNSILNVYANDTPGRPDDAYTILKFMESSNCSAKPDIVSCAA